MKYKKEPSEIIANPFAGFNKRLDHAKRRIRRYRSCDDETNNVDGLIKPT